MKKLISIFAIVLGAVIAFTSCNKDESEDVVYQLELTYEGTNSCMFTSTTPAEVKACYESIESSLSKFTNKYAASWTENVKNGNSASADSKAISKFNEAATELKALQTKANTDISNLPDAKGTSFTISTNLILRKIGASTSDSRIKTSSFSVSYPVK